MAYHLHPILSTRATHTYATHTHTHTHVGIQLTHNYLVIRIHCDVGWYTLSYFRMDKRNGKRVENGGDVPSSVIPLHKIRPGKYVADNKSVGMPRLQQTVQHPKYQEMRRNNT